MKLVEHSYLIRERARQPMVIDGKTFVTTVEFAKRIDFSTSYLRKLSAVYFGNFVIITVNEFKFVRIPRHIGDRHAPLYWRIDE